MLRLGCKLPYPLSPLPGPLPVTFSSLCWSRRVPTTEDGGRVVEEGVAGTQEQVGTIAPTAQVEEQLPGALG